METREPARRTRTARARGAYLALGAGLVLAAVSGLAASGRAPWSTAPASSQNGVIVRRGPLRIAVSAGGSLSAAETVRLASGVEGRTTILSIAPQGAEVREGEVVCELDATVMVEKRIQQTITLANAEASLVKARQQLEIQRSQNRSDIQKAEQVIDFALQDLTMFLEGERHIELEQAQQAVELAQEEEQRARNHYAWSEKLSARGFLTASELEADRIAVHRGEIALQQARRSRELLETFRIQRREAELRAAVEEARQEGERVRLQADARLIDFEADVRTSQATLELEQQKLARIEAQVEKARLRAPRDGYVVYAQRDRDEPPIQAGAEVREREEILSIPSSDGMVVGVKLHESVLKQVRVGQECSVTVDALPGVTLAGRTTFVAPLPDQNSWWANPNLRVYRVDVAISTPNAELRPGMSCAVEILVEELADATYVPVQCVFLDRSGPACFVVDDDGDLERRPVRVGRSNELWVQILEGVSAGEVVTLTAPPGFSALPDADEPADEPVEPPR